MQYDLVAPADFAVTCENLMHTLHADRVVQLVKDLIPCLEQSHPLKPAVHAWLANNALLTIERATQYCGSGEYWLGVGDTRSLLENAAADYGAAVRAFFAAVACQPNGTTASILEIPRPFEPAREIMRDVNDAKAALIVSLVEQRSADTIVTSMNAYVDAFIVATYSV